MEGESPSKLLRKLPKFTITVMEGIVRTDSGGWGGRAGRSRGRQRVSLSHKNEEQMTWEGWSSSGVELLQVIHLSEAQSQILWSLGQFSVSVVYTVEIILEAQNSPRIFIPGVSYLLTFLKTGSHYPAVTGWLQYATKPKLASDSQIPACRSSRVLRVKSFLILLSLLKTFKIVVLLFK